MSKTRITIEYSAARVTAWEGTAELQAIFACDYDFSQAKRYFQPDSGTNQSNDLQHVLDSWMDCGLDVFRLLTS